MEGSKIKTKTYTLDVNPLELAVAKNNFAT